MEIKLWEKDIPYLTDADTPNAMHTFLVENAENDLPCVVIFAGGAYAIRADHEATPYAEYFRSRGIHAVIVDYRVAPNRYPAALADAQRAVKIVRANAKAWHVDPEKIVVCGSSAGGHLAGSVLLMEDVSLGGRTPDDVDKENARPNGAILCYPVISASTKYAHSGSAKNLLGENYERDRTAHDLENRVTEATPKCFLWHTSDDNAVNVKNSLIFCEKLRDFKIPFELHIFPHGAHGLGLAQGLSPVDRWISLAADWVLREI